MESHSRPLDPQSRLGRAARSALYRLKVVTPPGPPEESRASQTVDEAARRVIERVRPYTMSSEDRLIALIDACRYIAQHEIPGDVVECGVWKGGSMMTAALTLHEADSVRGLHLFDTFEGMTPPSDPDVLGFGDRPTAHQMLDADPDVWSITAVPLEEVQANMRATGYPSERMHFVKGPVEETIPEKAPDMIALLRLDTDWYESTKHELLHLFPRLAPGGVLIVDDYGHWQGARQAVDEYLEQEGIPLLLHRIDYTGRIAVKPWSDHGSRSAA